MEEVWEGLRYQAINHSAAEFKLCSCIAGSPRSAQHALGYATELLEPRLLSDAAVVTCRLNRPLIKMSGQLFVHGASEHPACTRQTGEASVASLRLGSGLVLSSVLW